MVVTTLAMFVIGFIVGAMFQRTRFCTIGAFVEYFVGGMTRRLKGVLAMILVFGLVHVWGFAPAPT